MQFSPYLVEASILVPLKYYFSTYTSQNGFFWDEDEKKRTVEIVDVDNYHKIAYEERPRILVSRGTFVASSTGLNDNLAQGYSLKTTKGNPTRTNMLFYNGTGQVIVEAGNKGTCEVLADMAMHFIAWSRPLICDTQGFKEFANTLQVSQCSATNDENKPKFQVSISFPYMAEEHFQIQEQGLVLKRLLTSITTN